MKTALLVSGIVIVGAVVYYLVTRQQAAAVRASSGAGDIDPVTGVRWQTVDQARRQADASAATQDTTAVLS